jgi:hypothetical protein
VDRIKEKECERLENSFPCLVVEFCSFEHRVVFQVNIVSPFSVYVSSFPLAKCPRVAAKLKKICHYI